MKSGGLLLLLLFSILTACAQERGTEIQLKPAFGGLRFAGPLWALSDPQVKGGWLVVEKQGTIRRVVPTDGGDYRTSLFADLRDRVDSGPSEAGLLGAAFDPDYPQRPYIYLSYTRSGSPLVSTLSRFTVQGERLVNDSEERLLELEQPYSNHNGGHILFGPDGMLYYGLGDGGSGGDPKGNGQNTGTLLGALLRLDVSADGGYRAAEDNPLVGSEGRDELYAWGLRNPWRFSFDRHNGELWLADVGQNQWEEVDRIEAGGNYGWNIREGAHCYGADDCRTEGLIDPVAEYSHDYGCSITGGYVYRGEALPSLEGHYLYADFCSGTIWHLDADTPELGAKMLLKSRAQIASFAEAPDGEVLVIDITGTIYRLGR